MYAGTDIIVSGFTHPLCFSTTILVYTAKDALVLPLIKQQTTAWCHPSVGDVVLSASLTVTPLRVLSTLSVTTLERL